ncbi:hypothetical protein ORI20_07710 [Mycobacterium sp. CVI_P3]|uniref:DUF5642 domain-containing protein n=1 Tax=Mycobacterium pinniadriaticum TaxID=2994102 RepID=A0ABT3SBA0_9MYCO|nr:hypothetical protein [Mycobacterium pinniadriaticum]MCX2930155.1 hypothetical protein [Mycobacterium pinniadriaticum]MCX2936783.1 hypothetical protein [Mycobacterium pinniadriaticum]
MSFSPTDELRPVPRRSLTQKPAALVIGALMLAVPLVPMIADATLPPRQWNPAEPSAEELTAVTEDGDVVVIETPQGWEALDGGDSAVLRHDGAAVYVDVYDRGDRDPDAVAERLIRQHRIQGITSALDGGTIELPDGTLTGDTCVVVTASATGTCAFLHDDDVIVSVLSLAEPGQPAPPISQVLELFSRRQQ